MGLVATQVRGEEKENEITTREKGRRERQGKEEREEVDN